MIWIQTGGFLIELFSGSPEETEALGAGIAAHLTAGSVIALRGALGAGKTCLAKGIARGLGIAETVTSPTYTIVSEYCTAQCVPLYHIDAYRLSGDEDFENTGALELLGSSGIALIEWSERIPCSIPSDAISINIEICGPAERVLRISGLESLNER